MHEIQTKTKKGYVALFAVLIASIVLAMALGIANISLRELTFTSTAKESNFAFFAADTGSECALYHDRDVSPSPFLNNPPNPTITCRGQNLQASSTTLGASEGGGVRYIFPALTLDRGCVLVTLIKDTEIDPSDATRVGTRITAKGYNVSCTAAQAATKPSSLVERVLEYTYENNAASGTGTGAGTGTTATGSPTSTGQVN